MLKRLGGVKGCTHITDLLVGPLAVTANQTIFTARQRRKTAKTGKKPPQINTCHAYAQNSEVVERQWPEFYEDT